MCSAPSAVNDFFFRRVRLLLDVTVGDFLSARLQPDFAGGKTQLQDAYLRLTFADDFQVSMGQFKRAFDLFELSSSTDLSLIERDGRIEGVGNCAGVGVGVTGTAAKPYRAGKVEAALRGKVPTKENVKAAAQSAADGVDVQSDLYASEDYRAHLTRVQTERALSRAAAGAAGKK